MISFKRGKNKVIYKCEIFLDSANLNEIEEIASFGLLDGATTNPSLVAKENGQKNFKTIIKKYAK